MSNAINVQAGTRNAASAYVAAQLAWWCAVGCIILLAVLHILSPEFDPSWRMVSEYALGNYNWVLSLFFISWAVSSWALYVATRQQVKTRWGKIGLGFLIAAGIGQAMAAVFDVRQEALHGLAAMIGMPTLPIGAMLISYSLKRNPDWSGSRKKLLWTANLTWISIVLMTVSVMILFNGFEQAGIKDPAAVKTLPAGVIAFAGWANRLLIVLYLIWAITVAREAIRLRNR